MTSGYIITISNITSHASANANPPPMRNIIDHENLRLTTCQSKIVATGDDPVNKKLETVCMKLR